MNKLENWSKLQHLEDARQLVYRRLYPMLQQSDDMGIYKAIGLEGKLRTRLLKEVPDFRVAVAQLLRHHLKEEVKEDETEKRVLIQSIVDDLEEAHKLSADILRIEIDPNADHSDIKINVGSRAA